MIQIFAGSLRQRTRITMITLCPFGRYCRPVCCTFSLIQYNRNVATKTLYVCSNCGHAEPKWLGRCPDCGEWSTFVEEVRESKKVVGFAERAMRQKGGVAGRTLALSEVPVMEGGDRMDAGVGELNRVLGGGIVPGSMVLVGGEPGVGKSTLLLQVLGHLGEGCLMVSGEESPRQVALSARRLGVEGRGFRVLSETDVDIIEATILQERPRAVVVDSIQTLYSPELSGAPGGVGQVRESAARLMRVAKSEGIAILLVGHVTKEEEIPPGVVTVCLLEGTRPMLVEIESLVVPSPLAVPRRVANGVDSGRVNMLCAVLSRRAGLSLGDHDVYVNVTGGVRVEEPAADLGVALAIASALRDNPVGKGTGCFGEVGLTGDLRFVSGAPRRTSELLKLGFGRIIKPEGSHDASASAQNDGSANGKASVVEVKTLEEAVAVALL